MKVIIKELIKVPTTIQNGSTKPTRRVAMSVPIPIGEAGSTSRNRGVKSATGMGNTSTAFVYTTPETVGTTT